MATACTWLIWLLSLCHSRSCDASASATCSSLAGSGGRPERLSAAYQAALIAWFSNASKTRLPISFVRQNALLTTSTLYVTRPCARALCSWGTPALGMVGCAGVQSRLCGLASPLPPSSHPVPRRRRNQVVMSAYQVHVNALCRDFLLLRRQRRVRTRPIPSNPKRHIYRRRF